MNITFFKLAFRNIQKNRLNSGINVLGFSLGIAACLFIFLFVKQETSFDDFHLNSDRIFRVTGAYHSKDGTSTTGFTWFPTAPDIKDNIPGIEAYCRVTSEEPVKCYSGKQIHKIDKFRFADENFFSFFNFKLKIGNPETVLDDARKLVLTEEKARQLFGDADPIGQILMYNHELFTVSGIAADPPSNTQLEFDALASVYYIAGSDDYWKGWGGGITFLSYLLLQKGVHPLQIEQALPDLLNKKINRHWAGSGMSLSASLQNISEVHLSDGSIHHDCSTNRSKKSIYIVAGISLLILLLAVVNYIILYTAQKMSKTKDMGLLKMFGALKSRLLFQSYVEVVMLVTIASVLGLFLLATGLPFLNNNLHTSVAPGKEIFPALIFLLLTIVVLSLIVTVISTRHPVSSKTIDAIKNTSVIGKTGTIRENLLISVQFTIVIILLISVIVISRQNRFLLSHELGFNKENIVTVFAEEEFLNNELDGFKQDVLRLASVRSVSLTSQTVGRWLTQNGYKIEGQQETTSLHVLYTDADFLECFGIDLVEGRNFSSNSDLDKDAILINQQLVKKSGWDSPLDKTLKRDGKLKVIGVVRDFNFASLENTVNPVLIMSNPAWDGWGYYNVNIRMQTSDIQGFIRQLDHLWKDRFPETPFKISFLDDELASNYESVKAQQKIVSFFSLLAVLIALVGLFGLTVFTTQTRIKEIGIRKVNGARISEILTMLNAYFLKWVIISFGVAVPVAFYIMHRWLESFAYKTALSWWIFALAGLLALGIALLTVSWQSWKAATRNPVEALRYE